MQGGNFHLSGGYGDGAREWNQARGKLALEQSQGRFARLFATATRFKISLL
jgi:hypothetical protein